MAESIPSTGALIFLSIKPLIRLLVPAGAGFLLVRLHILAPSGTRSASQIILNVTLPALLFSKIVPSFSNENISALGPLFLTAAFYQGFSLLSAVIVRTFTQTPKKFRYGFMACFTFSNWGDLPTAVVQTVTASSPFLGGAQTDLAIAYVAIFILFNYISMFPLQGLKFVKMDYSSPINEVEERACENAGGLRKFLNRVRRGKPMQWEMDRDAVKDKDEGDLKKEVEEEKVEGVTDVPNPRINLNEEITTASPRSSPQLSRRLSEPLDLFPCTSPSPSLTPSAPSNHPSSTIRVLHSIGSFFNSLVSPPTVALLAAIIIAIVPTFKSLFLYTDASSFHPVAPDGKPPLAVLYDAASFVGAASVPLGLLVLGASLAKMKVPRPIVRLPLASIIWMAVIKLAISPIFGFFFVEALVGNGLVERDNHVLRFVLTYFSCVPTGTMQIAYTQIFGPENGENNADLMAAYLIAQYMVFAISSVVLTAMELKTIF